MVNLMMHFVAPSVPATAFATAFVPQRAPILARIPPRPSRSWHGQTPAPWARRMSDQPPDDDGADLAAAFFKSVQARNIEIDFDEEDEEAEEAEAVEAVDEAYADGAEAAAGEDEEADDDDDAILREYDVVTDGSLSDAQIYEEVKDRVFSSAGAFVELTTGGADGGGESGASQAYTPPTDFPDPGLTAGEVVESVLAALRNNDVPRPDYGVEVLFGYSSPESQITEQIETDGLTPAQYRSFLRFSEDNGALFEHAAVAIDKADYSPDGMKGYFTARLMNPGGSSRKDVSVNFILSTTGDNDSDCWLIDSMLIRPPKLRRRRR